MRHGHPLHARRWVLALAAAALILALAAPSSLLAQIGGSIGYGTNVLGSISAPGASLTYSFTGSAGDYVQVVLRNWSGTLDPRLELAGPDGQTLAGSGTNPLSADPLSALVSLFLPQTGIYTLHISGEQNTSGEFILHLHGHSPQTAVPLVYDQALNVTIPTNPTPQFFSFETQDCPTVLTISNLSDGEPFTFPYFVRLLNPQGTQIGQWYGGDALEDRAVLPPSSGRYQVIVTSDDPTAQGMIELLVTCASGAPGCVAAFQATGLLTDPCPPCYDDEIGGELCDSFDLTVTLDELTANITWPPVEGADYYIFSILDLSTALLDDSPRMLEGETSNSYTFSPADLARGPFTAIVTANAEAASPDALCIADAPISFEDTPTDRCAGLAVGADVVPGARMAVVHWDAAPGAEAYLIHVYAYADDGGLIGIRVLTAPGDATTYHLADVFPGEYSRFQVRVAAYDTAIGGGAFGDMPQGYLCDGSTDISFAALGPVEWGPAS